MLQDGGVSINLLKEPLALFLLSKDEEQSYYDIGLTIRAVLW